ncbi:hypothetical protein FB451DRAFT_1389166 [Mycena latifolia]|nr:hypothetical protein FB451DRAFT_1389166 [Mycena latifolia]
MAPKRKSDVSMTDLGEETSFKENDSADSEVAPSKFKKTRVNAASSMISLEKFVEDQDFARDPRVEGVQVTPWPWLKEIGEINRNSYNHFMEEKNKAHGAANSTYFSAYALVRTTIQQFLINTP